MRNRGRPDWKEVVHKKLRKFALPPEREPEIAEEVGQCLEERFQEERGRGASAAEAYARVVREFEAADFLPREIARAVQPVRERDREAILGAGRPTLLGSLAQDLRYAVRTLLHSKTFALTAVLTLALGIGANTAIFSVVNGVLLRPLPFQEPEQLLWMWGRFHANDSAAVSPPDFLDYRAQAKSFESMAASTGGGFITYNLTGAGEPLRLAGAPVSAGYFELLGAKPLLGRTFRAEEERPGGEGVVILGHALWQERFGSDRNILGRALAVNGRSHTVVGVMEPGFTFPQESQLWTPIPFGTDETNARRFHFLRPVGRLRAGVSLQQAQAELDTIAAQLEQQYPESNKTWGIRLEPLRTVLVGNVEQPLLMLWAAVGLVLLIACANVANLLLARGEARQKEIAIRKALGAGRGRIVAQLLTESVLLALLGAAGGLALAGAGVALLRDLAPGNLPRVEEVGMDFRVFGFALLCALVTGAIAGVAPALHAMRVDSSAAMREGMRSGGGRMRTHRALVVAGIAVSLVLLIGAGLLLKSYWQLSRVPLGFVKENVLTTSLRLSGDRFEEDEARRQMYRHVIEKIAVLPGVAAVGGISILPMRGFTDFFFTIEGRPPLAAADQQTAQARTVAGEYFRAMQMRTLEGRTFDAGDTAASRNVIVINDAFVREFFPGEKAIGRVLVVDFGRPFRAEIIGVVAGARQALGRRPQPEYYVWNEQSPAYTLNLAVRTSGDPASLASAVRRAVWDVDQEQSLSEFVTMEAAVSRASALERFNAIALGTFAVLALLLAMVGAYGVLAYAVTRRTQEIGLRVALGANTRDVLWLVMRQGAVLAGAGVAVGLAGGYWLARAIRSLLFEVAVDDPITFTVAPLLLLAAACMACYVPARRAARVDPVTALRHA
jgi:putative ABC transport system permease protein